MSTEPLSESRLRELQNGAYTSVHYLVTLPPGHPHRREQREHLEESLAELTAYFANEDYIKDVGEKVQESFGAAAMNILDAVADQPDDIRQPRVEENMRMQTAIDEFASASMRGFAETRAIQFVSEHLAADALDRAYLTARTDSVQSQLIQVNHRFSETMGIDPSKFDFGL